MLTWQAFISMLGPLGPIVQTLLAGLLSKTFIIQTVARIGALLMSLIFKDRFERMKEQGEFLLFSNMRKDDLLGNPTLVGYNLKKAAAEERLNEYVRDLEVCDRLLEFIRSQDMKPLTGFSKGMLDRLVARRNQMEKDIQTMAKNVVDLEMAFEEHQLEMDIAEETYKNGRNSFVQNLEPFVKWGWVSALVGICNYVVYVTYTSVATLQPGTLFYDRFGLEQFEVLALYQQYWGHEIFSALLAGLLVWKFVWPAIQKKREAFNSTAYRLHVLGKLSVFILPGLLTVIGLGQFMDSLFAVGVDGAGGGFLREVLLLYVPFAGETIANLLLSTWVQAGLQLIVGGFLVVFMFKRYDFGPRKILETDDEKILLESYRDHQNEMLKSHASMRFAYRVLLADVHVAIQKAVRLLQGADISEEEVLEIEALSGNFNQLMKDIKKARTTPVDFFNQNLLKEIDKGIKKVEGEMTSR